MKTAELKVLQIFNKYLEFGGEEACVYRISKSLQKIIHEQTYMGATQDFLGGKWGKCKIPFLMQANGKILGELKALQQRNGYDLWQIHNVFPTLSVAVYELAAELNVPVVQYLHNYRLGCASATHFRAGEVCFDCRLNSFMPAIKHSCWRGSLPASLSMVAALKRLWKRGGIENIKAFIAISENQKEICSRMGLPEEKIHVLHHYLDEENANKTIPPEGGDVLFIGRLIEEKGLDLLIRAWGSIETRGRKLRIIGKGPMLDAIKNLIEGQGIRDVAIEGFLSLAQQESLWTKASFVVAPSLWHEPFGMVVLESWQHARPVLTTNLGSFPELISEGVDGWLAEPNVESLAKVLQGALDSPEMYESMGVAGLAKLREKHSEKTWLKKWTEIIEAV